VQVTAGCRHARLRRDCASHRASCVGDELTQPPLWSTERPLIRSNIYQQRRKYGVCFAGSKHNRLQCAWKSPAGTYHITRSDGQRSTSRHRELDEQITFVVADRILLTLPRPARPILTTPRRNRWRRSPGARRLFIQFYSTMLHAGGDFVPYLTQFGKIFVGDHNDSRQRDGCQAWWHSLPHSSYYRPARHGTDPHEGLPTFGHRSFSRAVVAATDPTQQFLHEGSWLIVSSSPFNLILDCRWAATAPCSTDSSSHQQATSSTILHNRVQPTVLA